MGGLPSIRTKEELQTLIEYAQDFSEDTLVNALQNKQSMPVFTSREELTFATPRAWHKHMAPLEVIPLQNETMYYAILENVQPAFLVKEKITTLEQ